MKGGLQLHRPWKIHNSRSLHEILEGIMPNSKRWGSLSGHLNLFLAVFLFSFQEKQAHSDSHRDAFLYLFLDVTPEENETSGKVQVECPSLLMQYFEKTPFTLCIYLLKKHAFYTTTHNIKFWLSATHVLISKINGTLWTACVSKPKNLSLIAANE